MSIPTRSRLNSLTLSDEEGLNCDYLSADDAPNTPTPPFDYRKFVNTKIEAARLLLTSGKSLSRDNKNKIVDIFNDIINIGNHTASINSEPLRYDTQSTQNSHNLLELKSSIISDLTGIIKTEINSLKNTFNTPQPKSPASYAAIAAGRTSITAPLASPIPVSKPALILSPASEESTAIETLKEFRTSVSFKDTKFSPADVKFVSNSKVRVEFDSVEQRDITLDKVKQAKCSLTAEPCRKLRPMIILKGVSNSIPCEQLSNIITTQNTFDTSIASGDIIFKFKRANRNSQLYNAVFLTAPPLWREIIRKGKINVDHQRVHVEEHVPLLQCYTCMQFGHTRKNCSSENPVCSHCSSITHQYKDCPVKRENSALDCYNCIHHNEQFKTRTFSCVQINLGRGRNATQELKIHTSNADTDFIFVNEPYTGTKKNMGTFPGYIIFQFTDQSVTKASILVKENIVSCIGCSEFSHPNLAIIKVNSTGQRNIYLVSIYIEPREDNSNVLDRLALFLERTAGSIHLVCGDFNGWHSMWGSATNNRRGNKVADLILQHDLFICNTGTTPTFVTTTHNQLRTSIIDVTLASDPDNCAVSDWTVNSNMCPSSDHSAIEFKVSFGRTPLTRNVNMSTFKYNTSGVKWDIVKEKFIDEINKNLNTSTNISNLSISGIDTLVDQLTKSIQQACNCTLPRTSGYLRKAPWWNEKLDTLKSKVLRIHHLLLNRRRRNRRIDDLLDENSRLRKEYAEAIRSTSTEHFREFCNRQTKEDVYSVTNRIIKTIPLRQPPATLRLEDGTFTTDSRDTAHALLDKFYPEDDDTN
ncbi:hypothetical protein B5X24_HaOG214181 [Helicoverpa armigera]|nr:hypothetical protein B5X24_HaOG214181 [Helicoverpa armigera]